MEIQQQLAYDLTAVFGDLTQIISVLNDEQLNTIPFEGSWTVGQVTEHIIKSSSGIPDGNTTAPNREIDSYVPELKKIFENMEEKAQADPSLWPGDAPHDSNVLLQALEENKQALLQIALQKEPDDLCMDMEFPTLAYLTRYEWLSFIIVHTRRHTNQIRNILQHLHK